MNASSSWTRKWDTTEHERIARTHRSEAAAIQAEYEQACGTRGVDQVAISPISHHAIGGSNTSTGVVVYFDRGARDPDALIADLRCHRAWMMLGPRGMDDCPLDLPGLQVEARGEGQTITLTLGVLDPKLLPELQRRVAAELETRTHTRH